MLSKSRLLGVFFIVTVYIFKIVFFNSEIFNRPFLLLVDRQGEHENELFYKYFLLVIYLSFISNWLCLLPNELAMTQKLCKVVFVELGQSLQKEN